jgi:putative FmdB family regulatory protein
MPIYEFKCTKCNDIFEILVRNAQEENDICCPRCQSLAFERVISATRHAVGESGGSGGAQATTRNCGSGSCTTYTVPGHSR